MPGGTYTLLVELAEATTVTVGALGDLSFDAGWYAYVGSALGTGGFGRVARHADVAAGDHDVRHWHVDYLLGDSPARIDAVAWTPAADIECRVAGAVETDAVAGFGASDCDCAGHLFGPADRGTLLEQVEDAHGVTRRSEDTRF